MRILITGGAGFIGSHLCERFIAEGCELMCVDNLITGSLDNLLALDSQPRFTFLQHNISLSLELAGELDYVLHFASPASPPDYLKHPIHTMKVGSLGTLNALGIAKVKRAKFLLASTSEVYGDPKVHPQPESYWGSVNSVGPRGVYDEAKRFAEALTMAYCREHRLDTRIVRIFNTYGPRMRLRDGRAIPNFITQALNREPITVYGNGLQTRSFCYIDDLVEGIVRLIHSAYQEPMNLGNPEEYTILQLAQSIVELTGSSSRLTHEPLPQDDPKQRCPDIATARRVLKWSPAVKLADGLNKTIPWFEQALRAAHGGAAQSAAGRQVGG